MTLVIDCSDSYRGKKLKISVKLALFALFFNEFGIFLLIRKSIRSKPTHGPMVEGSKIQFRKSLILKVTL